MPPSFFPAEFLWIVGTGLPVIGFASAFALYFVAEGSLLLLSKIGWISRNTPYTG